MSENTDGPFGGREIPDQITDEDLDREMFLMIERIKERAATIPPLDWLTGHARDAVRIAVCWVGFDCKELVGRLARVKSRGERLNVATVYRVMGEMAKEWDSSKRESVRS